MYFGVCFSNIVLEAKYRCLRHPSNGTHPCIVGVALETKPRVEPVGPEARRDSEPGSILVMTFVLGTKPIDRISLPNSIC